MGNIAKYRKKKVAMLTAAVMAAAWMPTAMAADTDLPTGGEAVKNRPGLSDVTIREDKDVTIRRNNEDVIGNRMNVTLLGQKGVIDWKTFNIGNKAEVNFLQGENKTGWMILNRVAKGNPSEIYGNLNGHGGTLFLVNPSGITFHEGASVDVGSLVASTLNIKDQDFIDGNYTFEGKTSGRITNLADIKAEDGVVAIFANKINNDGKITAGQVALTAGGKVTLENIDKYLLRVEPKINVVVNSATTDGLEKQLATDKAALQDAETRLKNNNNIINNSGKTVDANRNAIATYEKNLEEYNKKKADCEAKVTECENEQARCQAAVEAGTGSEVELANAKTALENAKTALANVNKDIEKANKGIETANNNITNNITNINTALPKVAEAKSDIEEAKAKISSDEEEIKKCHDEVSNNGIIKATDGYVLMSARAAQDVLNTVVNNSGTVEACGLATDKEGNIVLEAETVNVGNALKVDSDEEHGKSVGGIKIHGNELFLFGEMSAKAEKGQGGNITIDGKEISTHGTMSASGEQGGKITIKGDQLRILGTMLAEGTTGEGGNIDLIGNTTITDKLSVDSKESKGGTIDVSGERIALAGELSADGKDGGTINTKAKDNLIVFEKFRVYDKDPNDPADGIDSGAKVHAEAKSDDGAAGTWNMGAAQAVIDKVVYDKSSKAATSIDSDLKYMISGKVIGDTLANTNVNVVATPKTTSYYSDIKVKEAIEKTAGKNTDLTMTAGRNISVEANISSTSGALNIALNADNKQVDEKTNKAKSERIDGAVSLKADITTNGGNFETTGALGTYIGLKKGESAGTNRTISTISTNGAEKAGDITLNADNQEGAQVLIATGDTVYLKAKGGLENGKVTINGKVDSANAYDYGTCENSWDSANTKANGTTNGKETHLAVITSGLEDAVVSAALPVTFEAKGEAYIGGHVVAVKADDNGVVELLNGAPQVLDKNGNVYDAETGGEIMTIGNTKLANNVANGGWYKLSDGSYVRYWAWTAGEEKGTVFYKQTMGENAIPIKDSNGNITGYRTGDRSSNDGWKDTRTTPHGESVNKSYVNWAPGEPNDDIGATKNVDGVNKSQTALAVNYDTYKSTEAGKVFISQWDDISHKESDHNIRTYVVETELGHTKLDIYAGDTTINGKVGSLTNLDNVNIVSSGNINAKGSVKVDNNVVARAKGSVTVDDFINAEGGKVELVAGSGSKAGLSLDKYIEGHNISTAVVTAGQNVSMVADDSITINGVVTAKVAGLNNAVELMAQHDFKVGEAIKDNPKAVQVTGEGSAWKIYSNRPDGDDFGSLDSDNFAGWGWGNEDGLTYIPEDGNRFIFKYNPTLTFTIDEVGDVVDTPVKSVGYTVDSDINGKYTNAFKDGYNVDFMSRTDNTAQKKGSSAVAVSDGFNTLRKGTYTVRMSGHELAREWGYNIEANERQFTVTPKSQPVKPDPTPEKKITDEPGTESSESEKHDYKPQMDNLTTTNLTGTASYTANMQPGPSADRVLGLQTAELPFFNERNGAVKLYGTYDVSVDPEKVTMEPTAKVLPEPDQPKNQYREYEKELVTEDGSAKFRLTYNGSTLDIYPTDAASKALLLAGDAKKNVELESKAMFEAFTHMGISLDDLDGVYTHFEEMQVRSFRR